MKYPYIGRSKSNILYLVLSSHEAIVMDSPVDMKVVVGEYYDIIYTLDIEDVTRSFLAGTCVRILSPKHSKAIQQLAFNVGYCWADGSKISRHTDSKFLFFHDTDTYRGIRISQVNTLDKPEISIPVLDRESESSPCIEIMGNFFKGTDEELENVSAFEYLKDKTVEILSPEHGEYVQHYAFKAGYRWSYGQNIVRYNADYLHFHKNGIIILGNGFNKREVVINMPTDESSPIDFSWSSDDASKWIMPFVGEPETRKELLCEKLYNDLRDATDDECVDDSIIRRYVEKLIRKGWTNEIKW